MFLTLSSCLTTETIWGRVMIKHRHIDKICIAAAVAAVVLTVLLMFGESLGLTRMSSEPPYAYKLFDDSRVHEIDLLVDDWDEFLDEAPEEEYIRCDAVIDGEEFTDIGLRAKGNNSLSLVERYGSDRYSLKIEFDHYGPGNTYHGLDKMSLDASFQDNSYMKNYMTYEMMDSMEVPVPLCSYTWVKVNGEDRGLFLAIEEPEESFAKRVYGNGHGELYKPDYKSLEDENADVALKYTDDKVSSYDNIFRNEKFETSDADRKRLIEALKILDENKDIESAVDVDQVIRYFVVQTFVVNLDSYLGPTGHNYFLYEKDGRISILPWDYNLAYGTYSLGMPDPVNDPDLYVNYPIDTPAWGEVMLNRPLFHNLMQHEEYYDTYHRYYDRFLEDHFENGKFAVDVRKTLEMIGPYVKKDPTAFCSYEDFEKAVETFSDFCTLRSESIRKQLTGEIASTIRGQSGEGNEFVDASDVWLPDMGEIADLEYDK